MPDRDGYTVILQPRTAARGIVKLFEVPCSEGDLAELRPNQQALNSGRLQLN
jgi:hypothetical protein